ncbi:MAG: DUF1501 domain-containing protein [Planctomycetes bacterium]|nr:DUF1501 domain-containing protein [Planctomycetota bacterium]
MMSLLGPRGRLCDSLSRRELVRVGGLSILGFGLPDFLRQQVAPPRIHAVERAPTLPGFGSADSVIFVYLQGAPSHIDLWDPKPGAPAEIRGEFAPIATAAPGMILGEVLPQLARQAARFSLIRSVGCKPKGLPNHGSAIYMLMTGHDPSNFSPTGLAVPPSREDLPAVGAAAARFRPAGADKFSYVTVCGPTKEAGVVGLGQGAGILGGAFDPYAMYDDPTQPLKLEVFSLPGEVSLGRLHERVSLRRLMDAQSAALEKQKFSAQQRATGTDSFDAYYHKALSIIQSNAAVRAFRLEEEPITVRERFGMTRFGQSLLLARRLIEAETRFVQVTWPARSDDEPAPGPDGSWDTHRNNFPTLRNDRCPIFDHSLSALIEDMHQRGLLERTLVVAVGEFGRSPKIGAQTTNNVGPGGRDHWPDCYSALIAGGGVRPGEVFGESDRFGAYPKANPVHPYDLICTIFHALGIDPTLEYLDNLNRPRRLVDHGRAVTGLF